MFLLSLVFFIARAASGYPTSSTTPPATQTPISTLIPLIGRGPGDLPNPDTGLCDCPDTRNVREILWPCVTTLIVATWVSVHLNVPSRGLGPLRWGFLRFGAMIASIFAPEATIYWACMEWLIARDLTRKMKEQFPNKEWTMTHSFFVVMGGFVLHDKKEDIHRPVHPSQFITRLEAGEFLFPKISEEEIMDKSKGDGLSKSIAVIQIMWFVAKFIGRLKVGWEVTDIEVLTLATCVVMLVVYGFWWYKPLSVHFQMELESGPSAASDSPSSEPGEPVTQMELDEESSSVGTKPTSKFHSFKKSFRSKRKPRHGFYQLILIWRKNTLMFGLEPYDALSHSLDLFCRALATLLFPLYFIGTFACQMAYLHPVADWEDSAQPIGAPIYFDDSPASAQRMQYGVMVLQASFVAFSSLHYISPHARSLATWFSDLPYTESDLAIAFGFCCNAMLLVHFVVFLCLFIQWAVDRSRARRSRVHLEYPDDKDEAVVGFIWVGMILHSMARLALVVISLISLTDLPASAYLDLSWSDIMPSL